MVTIEQIRQRARSIDVGERLQKYYFDPPLRVTRRGFGVTHIVSAIEAKQEHGKSLILLHQQQCSMQWDKLDDVTIIE